jgi:hypothetical protein
MEKKRKNPPKKYFKKKYSDQHGKDGPGIPQG